MIETIVVSMSESASGLNPKAENPIPQKQFSDYEILEELARGGMGVVYKARQVKLNRLVALKMILTGQFASQEDIQRFHAEAEAAANLDHPGIVPIYDVGEHQGQCYFSMAFVSGPSLQRVLNQGPLPSRESAQLARQVAEAMAYAHERGVIHRDLKPANILLAKVEDARPTAVYLSTSGCEPGWYEPRVTDFGLAKRTEGESDLTGTGQVLGTPSYMPPEQATGQKNAVGPHSDVYALGAVLYCMLIGRPPFLAATAIDTLMQVLDQQPISPRGLNPQVARELDAICMQCLEKTSSRRYLSANALAEDLRRHLDGESISVRSINLVDRLARSVTHSRDDLELRAWGVVLLWFAPLVFLAEVGIYLHARGGPPYPMAWGGAIRVCQFFFMGLVLWFCRKQWASSMKSAGRQMEVLSKVVF